MDEESEFLLSNLIVSNILCCISDAQLVAIWLSFAKVDICYCTLNGRGCVGPCDCC